MALGRGVVEGEGKRGERKGWRRAFFAVNLLSGSEGRG